MGPVAHLQPLRNPFNGDGRLLAQLDGQFHLRWMPLACPGQIRFLPAQALHPLRVDMGSGCFKMIFSPTRSAL